MTYAAFLALFLLPPIALLGARVLRDRSGSRLGLFSIGALALIALLYTTPWDNYLVANQLWSYDPARVAGVTLGWVPLEEYLFFVLQPFATGLWTLWVLKRFFPASPQAERRPALRLAGAGLLAGVWIGAVVGLVVGLEPWRYAALILVWAIPPLALQWAYGADQLWDRGGAVLLAILPPTLYLAAADALAIRAGVWSINPTYSLGLDLLGILPVEEFLFFLSTNGLIAFALVLIAPRLAVAPRLQSS